MDSIVKERKRIFKEELLVLKNENYISSEVFELVDHAHDQYYLPAPVLEKVIKQIEKNEKENLPKLTKKVERRRKERSPEEIRERNISFSLYLGVILLLISGLFVATSNWNQMEGWMKAGFIALVSLLFYGLGYLSKSILKINKTAFAFVVLGNLFLPIFVLSISWFKLLGSYFSFTGEGKFILGAAGSFLLTPIYFFFSQKMSSRLFLWFSFIATSVGVGFSLVSFHLSKDAFFLGMVIYIAILSMSIHYLKKKLVATSVTKELIPFVQSTLILTTILMLIFYDTETIHGMNLILTAFIFLSMIFVSGKKEYHYMFTVLFIYGVYQLAEFSILQNISPVIYALAGVFFLTIPRGFSDRMYWEKIFRYTSTSVSILGFLYITIERLLAAVHVPSFALLFAYLIMAAHFIYLSNRMKGWILPYLGSVYTAFFLYEMEKWFNLLLSFESWLLPLFFIGLVLFVSGCVVKVSIIQVMKQSSRDVGWSIMTLPMIMSLLFFKWTELGIMLLFFGVGLILTTEVEKRVLFVRLIPWIIPLSFGFSIVTFGLKLEQLVPFYGNEMNLPVTLALASIILLFTLLIWRKKHAILLCNSFYIAQGFYTLSMLTALFIHINEWLRPLIILGGVVMYLYLYKSVKAKWVTYGISLTSLICYFTILIALEKTFTIPPFWTRYYFTFGGILLFLIVYRLYKRYPILANGYMWVGHLYFPISLLLTFVLNGEKSFGSFFISLSVYGVSIAMVKKEWQKYLFLYGSFLSLWMIFVTVIDLFFENRYLFFSYLLTSLFIFLFWTLSSSYYKRRTEWFLILFSIYGIFAFMTTYPFNFLLFASIILLIGLTLLILHLTKKELLTIVPLLMLWVSTLQFMQMNAMDTINRFLIMSIFGVILLFIGLFFYRGLYSKNHVDFYQVPALLFFISLYVVNEEFIWQSVLPGLLISLTIWLQKKRIHPNYSWVPILLSGLYLLEPYYSVMKEFSIPRLIEREVWVLPLIGAVIFCRIILKERYVKITSRIEWAILVIVSLLLIQDGLENSTIYDAIILGTLSLISILIGWFLQKKSYFFIGSGVLLLNVFLQTRPYWGHLPWWVYLLISGSILITVASYNEWHKQKTSKGETVFLSVWVKNWKLRFSRWK
ncbi:hypothetical protein [Bacillus sp. 03113]|uniref:hypothetical protein n=1 Tax=Bacillus sp. 03113 TaxID=2578211 RepID=UPI0011415047|nr:hypothetical protein [Bacillus sp. 03113]